MELNYKELGLKAGIECHQQLNTKKLFCNCPSILRDDKPDFIIKRKLKSVKGEEGKVDIAALEEEKKEKTFIYEGYNDTTCLVELDEEPIHEINKEALYSSLQLSSLLNAKKVDSIQVMRKIVVDGSNTSGFQRTALIATKGYFKLSNNKKVTIPTICLEEDSCKIISKTDKSITYRLDRLGIPLIEIATDPVLNTPEEIKEAAETLGMLLRSCDNIKRGLGTIRQDLNVSIKNGNRVEIKGAQNLKLIPLIINNEIKRQKKLIEIKEKLNKIATKKSLENISKVDLNSIFKNTESKLIKKALEKKGIVLGIKLPFFKGLLGIKFYEKRRLGSELSDYAKIIAGVGGIFHSDELPNYGINEKEIKEIKKALNCKEKDAFVLVAEEIKKAEKALDAVIFRAKLCFDGVIKEVRKALDNGGTSYLRPLPGSSRMYPETDIIPINPSFISVVKPKTLNELIKELNKKYNLDLDLCKIIVKSDLYETFISFCEKFNRLKPSFIADILIGAVKRVKQEFNVNINLSLADYEDLFIYLNEGKISKDIIYELLSKTNEKPIHDLIVNYKLIDDEELEKIVKELIEKEKKKDKNIPFKALIGIVMKKLKGKAEGKKIVEMVKKYGR